MGSIQILDEHIANQIAAGEVVERPASVVKELVENAVDAGSSRIDIIIEEGGLQLIRVTDNGSGMDGSDSELAFCRHATSKITSGKDLWQIRTLGFRGEALPSIAAVAKVECTTSVETNGLGRKIVIEGGHVQSVQETAAPRGTDMLVKELFYNTPARLKYMKTIQTELGHISDYIYRMSMAHPHIAFTLRHNGNLLVQTTGSGDLLQVIAAIYGSSYAKSMVDVAGETPDYEAIGFVSRPEITRANRSAVSLFVNGRYIKNYALSQAIMQAYHTLLPINRYPLAVLHIRMDPSLVDVNVHPAKLEVRFSKEAELTKFVERLVRGRLDKQVLIPQSAKPSARRELIQEQMELYRPLRSDLEPGGAAGRSESNGAHVPPGASPSAGHLTHANQPNANPSAAESAGASPRDADRSAGPSPSAARNSDVLSAAPRSPRETASGGTSFGASLSGSTPLPSAPPGDNFRRNQRERREPSSPVAPERLAELFAPGGQTEQPASLPAFPKLEPIGQLHGTYIVAQNESGLYLIDQHAAHERIHYEYYYDKFGAPQPASQQLIVPITLEFTSSEAIVIRDKLPLFEQVGVYLEHFGGNTFIVRAYPHWLPQGEEHWVIEQMAEWVIAEQKSVDLRKIREKSAILCSCKASIKANQSLGKAEMEALLDKLAASRNPYTCPHGRPIVVSFSKYELEKMFKRVM